MGYISKESAVSAILEVCADIAVDSKEWDIASICNKLKHTILELPEEE